ncbi:MAG: sigma-70 domain-containing protein [Acutalibacteraceae bacterium]
MKERAAAIKQARERLTGDFGRDPTVSELSEALGLSPEEIAAAETATSATESIQRQTGEEGFSLEDVLCTDGMEEKLLRTHGPAGGACPPERHRNGSSSSSAITHSLTQSARRGPHRCVAGAGPAASKKKALERLRNIF